MRIRSFHMSIRLCYNCFLGCSGGCTLRWVSLVPNFFDLFDFFGWVGLLFDCLPLFVGSEFGADGG
jgi:hypothetical protein